MTVTSVLDPVAAVALAPGMPVVWDVAVDGQTGSPDIQLTAVASGGAPEGLVVRSAPCPGALGDSCPASLGPITVTPGSPSSDLGGLAQVASGWVRHWIELPPGATQGSGQTALTVWVTAVGESIPLAPPSPGLAGTGPRWLGLASLASATFAATTMEPPAQLRCVQSGLLHPVVLAWDPPTSGAPVTATVTRTTVIVNLSTSCSVP